MLQQHGTVDQAVDCARGRKYLSRRMTKMIDAVLKICWFFMVYAASSPSSSNAVVTSSLSIQHPTLPLSQTPTSRHHQRRKVATDVVRKRLLAIRVSSLSSGETPEESLTSIRVAIFGNNQTSNHDNNEIPTNGTSVIEQYRYISHGQLLLEPVDTTTETTVLTNIDIAGGVFELNIPNFTFTGQSISNLTDIILQETLDQLGVSSLTDIADHILFCLPNGSTFQNDPNWTAYTFLNQPYSYYQLSRCTRLSVVVHELGHSLGFQHSGIGTSPYADKTGYMGFASNQIGYPRKAFNGHKHWISGWFRDRAVTVNPMSGPVEKRLVSFVNYSDGSDQMLENDAVLIRIGTLYVQYNRAKSYNIDTDVPNTVTITHATADDDVSDRLAALSIGETLEYPYTASSIKTNSNRILIIKVCSLLQYETSQLDYARIRIYFSDDNDVNDLSDCNKTIISFNKPTTPSVDTDLLESPSISPTAHYAQNATTRKNDPIVDRDDNTFTNDNSYNNGSTLSSSNRTSTATGNDGEFEGMIYIIVASALGVMLFTGTGYVFVAQHLKEQEKIMAIQSAHDGKYHNKKEKNSFNAPSSNTKNSRQRRSDVEDLSDTAEDEFDDESVDALYVMYDAHMLEI